MRRILVLILVLSTLLTATAPAARADDPVQRAIAWLHTQQLADGSFGNATWGSASVTADVVYVLALAGEDPGGPAWTKGGKSALDALAALTPDYIVSGDAGQAGKVARAVAAAGRNPRNFAGTDVIERDRAGVQPCDGPLPSKPALPAHDRGRGVTASRRTGPNRCGERAARRAASQRRLVLGLHRARARSIRARIKAMSMRPGGCFSFSRAS